MKLITELLEEVEIIKEAAENGDKKYYIHGPFAQAEKDNRNGRNYARPVMESAVSRYITEFVNRQRALGELNHPASPVVNMERASHIIESLNWDGNDVIGKARILNDKFPMAIIAKGLMDEGIKFGVSTRGMGTVKQNSRGINEVQNDFSLRAVDLVYDPSGPDCWVQGIMEGVDWVFDAASGNYLAQKVLEDARQDLKKMNTREIAENTVALWTKFLETL